MTNEEDQLAKKVEKLVTKGNIHDLLLLEEAETAPVQKLVNEIKNLVFDLRILQMRLAIRDRRKMGACD